MVQAEVEAFLTMLANERRVSPATQRQALNAILFLYKALQRAQDDDLQQCIKVAAGGTAGPAGCVGGFGINAVYYRFNSCLRSDYEGYQPISFTKPPSRPY